MCYCINRTYVYEKKYIIISNLQQKKLMFKEVKILVVSHTKNDTLIPLTAFEFLTLFYVNI